MDGGVSTVTQTHELTQRESTDSPDTHTHAQTRARSQTRQEAQAQPSHDEENVKGKKKPDHLCVLIANVNTGSPPGQATVDVPCIQSRSYENTHTHIHTLTYVNAELNAHRRMPTLSWKKTRACAEEGGETGGGHTNRVKRKNKTRMRWARGCQSSQGGAHQRGGGERMG